LPEIALITGAAGGMGKAAAQLFGRTHALFLTDIKPLDDLAAELKDQGVTIAGSITGDLATPEIAKRTAAGAWEAGKLTAVFHAAGLSPALGSAAEILRVNVLATELLLRALEEKLSDGLTAILIASMAAHISVYSDAAIEHACAHPRESDFVAKGVGFIEATLPAHLEMGTAAYAHSKLAVKCMVEARAAAWAKHNARILSISPGLINTPMGRAEIARSPEVEAFIASTPFGLGEAEDIAEMAVFLCSKSARYMTGSDVRLDGGASAVILSALRGG
jgi:NAD(P)-dependent dehydrogenase (short-subunit alcohol dehydrogenase family)